MDEPVELDSKITEVEVYRSESLITRMARLEDVKQGQKTLVRIAPLPFLLMDDSLRIGVSSSSVRVSDVSLEFELGQREGPVLTQAEQELRNLFFERHQMKKALERIRQ